MIIKKIIRQSRRDFTAIYECEHCSHEEKTGGYDDAYFHNHVVPEMICTNCGKKADKSYKPKATKYPEGMQV